MADQLFVVPSPREDGYVELARTQSGRLYRKQILKDGQTFVHPADRQTKIKVTPNLQQKLVENFRKGYCDTVQFPVTDSANRHDESVLMNLGEVIDVEYTPGKGTYAIIDARKHAEDVGKTILGASAFFSLDYEDTSTGQRVGPTLLHVAATNRPYLTQLEPYEEIVAASNVGHDSDVVMLSDEYDGPDDELDETNYDPSAADTSGDGPGDMEDDEMDFDAIVAELRDKHGIDLPALQASAEELTAAQQQLEGIQLSATDGTMITSVDLAEAVVELSNTVKAQESIVSSLRTDNERMVRERAEAEVDGLISDGKILPKQRATYIELSLTDRPKFEALVPDSPIVALSETGVTVYEEPEKAKAHDEEVGRYVSLAAAPAPARRKSRRGE